MNHTFYTKLSIITHQTNNCFLGVADFSYDFSFRWGMGNGDNISNTDLFTYFNHTSYHD